MARSRTSAKAAGTRFESLIAQTLDTYLAGNIERRARTGAQDKGDISGVLLKGTRRVVVECKDVAKMNISGWLREAQAERENDGAEIGVVVAKKRGTSDPLQQYVHMTLADFIDLVALAQ
ncbi:hypothetical protein [Tsukamurella soli]|uniref:Holliday junction resolvase n=1 Tax=Tsukamurella soli TaxID=644556 RepID=A0ABP8JJG3_9ACTN